MKRQQTLVFFAGLDIKALEKYSKALLWSGFALLLLTFILIDSSYTWPSAWALLPVLATALIMLAQRSQSILTAHPIAQWLGDRSYSLYLWHWPIMVALYFAGLDANWLWISAGLALSLLLGDLSYRLIETPTRLYFSKASAGKEILGIGALVMLVGVSAVSARLFVFEGRLAPEAELAAAENANGPSVGTCWADGSGKGEYNCLLSPVRKTLLNKPLILKGDSHSLHLRSAVIASLNNSKYTGLEYWGMSGCHSLENAMHSQASGRNPVFCQAINTDFYTRVTKETDNTIVIIDRTNLSVHGFNGKDEKNNGPWITFEHAPKDRNDFEDKFQTEYVKSMCKLSHNNTLFLMRPTPEMIVNPPLQLSRNIIFGRGNEDIKITLKEYHQRNTLVWQAQDLAAEQCGVKILNPLPYLCDDQYCYGSKNGRPLYYDDDHLSEYGNKFLVPMFEQVFLDQQSSLSQ